MDVLTLNLAKDYANEKLSGVFDGYDPEAGYTKGELRIEDNCIWEAKDDIAAPAGDFDESLWNGPIALADLVAGKVEKIENPVEGDLPIISEDGGIEDSGYAASDFMLKSSYDANGDVATAGGIVDYVAANASKVTPSTSSASSAPVMRSVTIDNTLYSLPSGGGGGGGGDMLQVDYDPDGVVLDAGGIPTYTESQIPIKGVQVNGTDLVPDANKKVDVEVPTIPTTSSLVKGDNAGGLEAAVAGTDYQTPLTAGTDYLEPSAIPTTSSLIKGNNAGGLAAAVAGTDYQTPLTAGTDYQTPLTAGTDYQTPITFDGSYDASTNKAATVSTVTNAINALDGGTIGTPGTGKTVTALSQANGNISATFEDIIITKSQVSDFPAIPSATSTTPKMDGAAAAGTETTWAKGDHVHPTDTSRAPLDSPALTGTPTAPTASSSTDSTQIATTAFVHDVVEALGSVLNYKGTKATESALPSSGNRTGDVWIVTADNSEYVWNGTTWEKLGPTIDLSGYVPTTRTVNNKALNSDITLSASDVGALPSSTNIPSATSTSPKMDGTAAVGSETTWAKGDHVHPTDTSRQATITASGILKGNGSGSVSAATADTDYATPSYVTVRGVQRNGTDLNPDTNKKVNVEVPVLGIQKNGTDITPDSTTKKVNISVPVVPTTTSLLKGNNAGGISAATAGTDYQTPLTAGTDYAIPSAIKDATLTIQKNGTTVNTFSANASSNVTANITVPTNTNELTNGAGFITNPAFPVTTSNTSLAWNTNVLRPATGTSEISAVAPTVSTYAATIHGIFKASGSTTTFTVASSYVIDVDGNKSASAGAGLGITTTADSVYEFDLYAISSTQALLVVKPWTL